MIYVDEVFNWPGNIAPAGYKHRRHWCHMWCDPGDEKILHAIARKIGLREEWFQHNPILDHYDLTPSKRELALHEGVQETSLLNWMKKHRDFHNKLFSR
jgi:hypothetical protein